MSTGRFIMRGWASQGWRAAGRALADQGVAPVLVFAGGVVAEFRGRSYVVGCRGRVGIAEYRSRVVTMESGR